MAHRVAPRAEADLDDIWLYVAKETASMDVATRLIDSITSRFSFLASFPYVGRARDEDLGASSRSFAVDVALKLLKGGKGKVQKTVLRARYGRA
jgi:plasmid stabilization system protein ParE